MADREQMVKEVLDVKLEEMMGEANRELMVILAERIWKLEARVAKLEGRL